MAVGDSPGAMDTTSRVRSARHWAFLPQGRLASIRGEVERVLAAAAGLAQFRMRGPGTGPFQQRGCRRDRQVRVPQLTRDLLRHPRRLQGMG